MIRGGRLGGTCFRVILCACFEGGVLTFFFFLFFFLLRFLLLIAFTPPSNRISHVAFFLFSFVELSFERCVLVFCYVFRVYLPTYPLGPRP